MCHVTGSSRSRVLQLYKTFLYYGRDWPNGYIEFRNRCKGAFAKNKDLTDQAAIENCIARGEFVLKEIEALYKLKKYRTLKKMYYADELK